MMSREEAMKLIEWMKTQGIAYAKVGEIEVSFFPQAVRHASRLDPPQKPKIDPKENPHGHHYGVTDETLFRSA
jgi:hypothetical protein